MDRFAWTDSRRNLVHGAISNTPFGASPNISGAYIASTRVGGNWKRPSLFRRRVYSRLKRPREDYSLWFGCVKGRSIKCSLHGSYFDLASGKPLNEPADCPLATYPAKMEDGQVWVDAG